MKPPARIPASLPPPHGQNPRGPRFFQILGGSKFCHLRAKRRRFAAVHTFKRAEIISVGTAFLPGKVRFATTSFYACGKKRRHPPASLLLLSKPNPLRWASVWCRRFAAILFHHNKLLIFDLSSCSSQASYRLRRSFSFYYKAHRALILLLLTPKLDPL